MKFLRSLFVFLFSVSGPSLAATKVTFLTEQYAPFQSVNSEGEYAGFSIDIVNALSQHVEFDVDVQMMPWSRAFNIAKTTPNTFIFTISKTEERMNFFTWVGDFYQVEDVIYCSSKRDDIVVKSIDDVKNYTIAIPRADVALDVLHLREENAEKIYLVNNQKQAIQMLSLGRVDLNFNNRIGFSNEVKALGLSSDNFEVALKVNQSPFGLATHKQTDKFFIKQLGTALKEIKENGKYQEIVDKWFSNV